MSPIVYNHRLKTVTTEGAMTMWLRTDLVAGSPDSGCRARPLQRDSPASLVRWTRLTVAGVIAVVVVVCRVLFRGVSQVRFVIVAPTAKAGFEVFLALLRLFAALVLFLFPSEAERPRLRWVALGFMILGLGCLGFGYLYP